MRANRQSGVVARVSSASPISGAIRRAGGSRSLRVYSRVATRERASRQPRSGNRARLEKPPVRPRKTADVGTATPGLSSTIPISGNVGAGAKISPVPDITAGRQSIQTGTSAPSAPPSRLNAAVSSPQNRHSNRNAAAASAEPPPIPEATGRFFSRTSLPAGGMPACSASRRAARRIRLSASSASRTANGPTTDKDRSSAGETPSRSPIAVNTTRLSSRWYPSARRPTTCRCRLTFAGANSDSADTDGSGGSAIAR